MPIIREETGLAMSSRNSYLSEDERKAALSLSRGLKKAEAAYSSGEKSADKLKQVVIDEIKKSCHLKLMYYIKKTF